MLRTKILLIITSLLIPLTLLPAGAAYANTSDQLQSGVNAASGQNGCPNPNGSATPCQDTLNGTIAKVVNILSSLVGVVAVIMIIVAGFRYVTSGGNSETAGKARSTILYAVVGLVVVALAQVIVRFVLKQVT